jgi:hypothetical protein
MGWGPTSALGWIVTALAGIAYLTASMSLGRIMVQFHDAYQPIASLFTTERSVGFNAIYRILFAPVATLILAIAFYLLRLDALIPGIWIASVWFAFWQSALFTALGQWQLISKPKYAFFHLASAAITRYVYHALIVHGLAHLLPDEANLRTDVWLVVIAFLYGIFRSIPESFDRAEERKRKYVNSTYRFLRQKYEAQLAEMGETLRDAIIATMIYENFNRPLMVRYVERALQRPTRTILQVHGAITDAESIAATATAFLPYLREAERIEELNEPYNPALYDMLSTHNPADPTYAGNVVNVYNTIRGRV